MRVTILHDDIPSNAPIEDNDTLVQVTAVAQSLERLGHAVTVLPCTLNLEALRRTLVALKPDMVFNLVESLGGCDSLTYLPLAVLDELKIPYTGNQTQAIYTTGNKLLAKSLLRFHGLPTPSWTGNKYNYAKGSWIIKNVWGQASRSIDDSSVLMNVDFSEVLKKLAPPCFAERFIEGCEFNVSMLAGEVLPPAEIVFNFPAGKPKIVGYKAKWEATSFEYKNTMRSFEVTDKIVDYNLRRLAKLCWQIFELRGWARIDFRVDSAHQPWILEINTNPCLSPDAGFTVALQQASISFDSAIQTILEN